MDFAVCVKHVFVGCSDLQDICYTFYMFMLLKELFEIMDVSIKFVKEILFSVCSIVYPAVYLYHVINYSICYLFRSVVT